MSKERENKNRVFRQGAEPIAHEHGGVPRVSTADRMKQLFGVETVPADLVRLPSEGKIYPTNSGLFGRRELEIKAMTTHEQNILTSKAYIKKGTTITELIRSCVTDPTVDVDQLVAGDRNALMVAIRITGYGETFKTEVNCPRCGQANAAEFHLGKLALKPLGAEPIAPGVNEFEFRLPRMGVLVTFKILTAKEEEEIVSQHDRKKKLLETPMDTLLSDQLKTALQSANGQRGRADLAMLVDNMTGLDANALRDRMNEVKPDIDMRQLFECAHCDFAEEVEVPIDLQFFWPSARRPRE